MNPTRQRTSKPKRLDAIRHWLISGVPAYRIPELAAQLWTTRPKQILKDIAEVKAGWAMEAATEDYLSHLWLAKLQREQFYDKLLRLSSDCKKPELSARYMAIGHQCVKERDKLMTQIEAHRRKTLRDRSPDHTDHRGQRLMVITEAEFLDRCNKLADQLIYERQIEEREKERCAQEGVPYLNWHERNAAALGLPTPQKAAVPASEAPQTPHQPAPWPSDNDSASAPKHTPVGPSGDQSTASDPASTGQDRRTEAHETSSASASKHTPPDGNRPPETKTNKGFTSNHNPLPSFKISGNFLDW